MNHYSNIVHLPERGVFSRDLGSGLSIETEDTCGVCGEKSDEPVMCSSCSRGVYVNEAVEWLRDHPEADYLDAAAAVAYGSGGELSRSGWPDFVGREREADAANRQAEQGQEVER
jgi:hypothetical protein